MLKMLIARSSGMVFSKHDEAHSLFDDMQAMLTGALLLAIGMIFFKSAGILTGGVAGLALIVHYSMGWNLGLVFFLMNIPFYVLAYRRFGKKFTLKSITCVSLLSLLVAALPNWIAISMIDPFFSAMAGGLLIGIGMITLFRHRSSVGGFNVLILYLQDKFGWNAGLVQLILDACIILASFLIASPMVVIASILGAVVLNFSIAVNHRPGRYISF